MTPRKVFVRDFTGLANRLEAASLALIFQASHGCEICLDWPELDAFSIAGTKRGKMRFWHKLSRRKLYDFENGVPASALDRYAIDIRGIYGPRDLQRSCNKQIAARMVPGETTVRCISDMFLPLKDVPTVGVHIRRGDFFVSEGDAYSPGAKKHNAPPIWWYEKVMESIRAIDPATAFYLAHNSDEATIARLKTKFRIIESPSLSSYTHRPPGHASQAHPVVDLFALACCRSVIATPYSSFSHWAANLLGDETLVFLPTGTSTPSHARVGIGLFQGEDIRTWNRLSREGCGLEEPDTDFMRRYLLPPATAWLHK